MEPLVAQQEERLLLMQQKMDGASESSQDPFHDPVSSSRQNGHAGSSDIVDELLKPLQSYFNTYRTGQFASLLGGDNGADGVIGGGGSGLGPLINGAAGDGAQQPHHQLLPRKGPRPISTLTSKSGFSEAAMKVKV